jgi:hypothetical protein
LPPNAEAHGNNHHTTIRNLDFLQASTTNCCSNSAQGAAIPRPRGPAGPDRLATHKEEAMNSLRRIEDAATAFILDPANHDLLTLVKGVRSGIVYGCKVRFPHALVCVCSRLRD